MIDIVTQIGFITTSPECEAEVEAAKELEATEGGMSDV